MMGPLSGKTAVITGATGGIGRSVALALAREGVNLCLLGRERARCEGLLAQVATGHPGLRTAFQAVDLADVTGVRRACESLLRDQPAIDLLVHCAGLIVPAEYASAKTEDFDAQYFINVRAPFLLTQGLLSAIRARKGQVVFVNSSAAQQKARGGMAAYAASKYALTALADSLRDEVNADGVRVISVYPGRTATAMQEQLHEREGKPYRSNVLLQPDDVAEAILHALMAPLTAEITDISIRPFQKG
ncbi:MAG: SDR family NAD(P)-dependent oxidoreductase [Gammaproteobacteria bacterium]|nr:SDR family NAD(P)-dependent oxidoreductase [Gammaproteobacteria bacterium]